MINYGKLISQFWTGETGKRLRGNKDAQILGAYLMSNQLAKWTGLYYLPLPSMWHETGLNPKEACKALQRLSEEAYAFYDEATETVWVPEMARIQIGESLQSNDNRVAGIKKDLQTVKNSPFLGAFIEKYNVVYHLNMQAPPKALTSPLQASPKGQVYNPSISQPLPNPQPLPKPVEEKEHRRFAPPTVEEVQLLWRERAYPSPDTEPIKFHAYYASNGWRVGKNPMRDWRVAAAGWAARCRESTGGGNGKSAPRHIIAPDRVAKMQEWQKKNLVKKEEPNEPSH